MNILDFANLAPMTKFGIISICSLVAAGICAIRINVKSMGFDTITDLKKRSKDFNQLHYKRDKRK